MTWDLSADVVVVGYGAAGVSAALEARASGADVLALDRFNGGGATRISGGVVYAGGGTSVQRSAGVTDSPEAMLAYLRMEVGDAVSDTTLRRFVADSPAMIDWLAAHGVPFDPSVCPYRTSYPTNRYYLYFSGSEKSGGYRETSSPAPRGHRAKARNESGRMVYGPLAASAAAHGVRFQPHTRVLSLIVEDGRVVGVHARSMAAAPAAIRRQFARLAKLSAKPGMYYPPLRRALSRRLAALEAKHARPVRIQARSGVIVSAGGFIANRALVAEHAPAYRGGLALGTEGDDGAGIQLGVSVGAATDRMSRVSAWRFIAPPSALLGSLLVGPDGKRLADESRYGAALADRLIEQHAGVGWLLADAELIRDARAQLSGQSLWFHRVQAEGLFRRARRGPELGALARSAGIDADALLATVDAHNRAVDSAAPDPMGKPAEYVRPLRTAPFYLLDVSIKPSALNPCPMMTLGGLVVDEASGAVKTPAGESIPGLYAAGRSAVGICSESYVSGLSLADCIFSGRRAGRSAASSVATQEDSHVVQ